MEIGVGTGRFAGPLGVTVGIEPSSRMRSLAMRRGIKVLGGVAENLPFKDSAFTHVLMVTTICFLDDVHQAFHEVHRVLSEGGHLIIGFVDRSSLIGQEYLQYKNNNVFYKEATFYSVDELLKIMKNTSFDDFDFCQTIFRDLSQITEHEVVKPGYGQGSFIVVRGKKKEQVDR
jgi:ubiquinone/menaquinone biosynthesis C-methylase UbiE